MHSFSGGTRGQSRHGIVLSLVENGLGFHGLVAAARGRAASALIHLVVPHHTGLGNSHARAMRRRRRGLCLPRVLVHAELSKGRAEVIEAVAAAG